MTNNGKPTTTGVTTLEPAAPELDRQTLDLQAVARPSERVLRRVIHLLEAEGHIVTVKPLRNDIPIYAEQTGSGMRFTLGPNVPTVMAAEMLAFEFASLIWDGNAKYPWHGVDPGSLEHWNLMSGAMYSFSASLLADLYADEARRLVP